MLHLGARRELEAPPPGAGDQALRLLPAANRAVEVQTRHALENT